MESTQTVKLGQKISQNTPSYLLSNDIEFNDTAEAKSAFVVGLAYDYALARRNDPSIGM
jgi:hypothetical protein